MDDTKYLLKEKANRERLLKSIDEIEHFDGEFGLVKQDKENIELSDEDYDVQCGGGASLEAEYQDWERASLEDLDKFHFNLYEEERDELFKDPGNPSNQKTEFEGGFVKDLKGKLQLDLTPPEIEEIFTSVLEAGLKKGYPRDSWTKKGATEEMFLSAARRHINKRRKGEKIDPETGCSHLAHAGWQLMAAAYHELKGNFNDTK